MRAQTTLDFAIGISLFLVTTVFVFGFVPGVLQPFNDGAQEETVVADRVASQLVQASLVDPEEPYILETPCVRDFFQEDATQPPDETCRFNQSTDLSGSDVGLTHRLGLAERQRVNVTIRGDVDGEPEERLCWDGDTDELAEEPDCDSNDVLFTVGDAPPDRSGTVVSSRRAIGIEGHDATLVVKVW